VTPGAGGFCDANGPAPDAIAAAATMEAPRATRHSRDIKALRSSAARRGPSTIV